MITAFYAALLALLYLCLTGGVILGRWRYRIALGDAGNDNMQKRIRAHGNFAEYVPFTLLLLMFAEMHNAPLAGVHTACVLLLAGRVLHAGGMIFCRTVNPLRMAGTVITLMAMLLPALWCLWVFAAR